MLVDGAAIAITKRGGRHRCAYIQKRIGDNQMSKITRGETNKKVEKYAHMSPPPQRRVHNA